MKYTYLSGTNGKTIVLVHGFVSSQRYWQKLIPYLHKEGYSILSIDLAGFGSSRRVKTARFGYEVQLDHIRASLDRCDIEEPVTFIGHSMGALIVAKFAAKYPRAVSQAILLHPPLYLSPKQAIDTLLQTSFIYRFLLFSRLRSLTWGLIKLLPNQIANHAGIAREQTLRKIILADGNAELLTNPAVQTLLVVGDTDRDIYRENLAALDLSATPLNVKVIRSDHHSPVKQPRMVSSLIDRFVSYA